MHIIDIIEFSCKNFNRYKKVFELISISCIVIISMLLFGCNINNNQNEEAISKEQSIPYKEFMLSEDLAINNVTSIDMNKNNEIALYQSDGRKLTILDKNNTKKAEISIASKGNLNFTFTANDEIAVFVQEYNKDDKNKIISSNIEMQVYDSLGKKIDSKSIIKKFNSKVDDEQQDKIKRAKIDQNGNLYILKMDGTLEGFDSKLNSIHIFESKKYKDITLDDSDDLLALYIGQDYEKVIERIDTKNFKSIWKKEYKGADEPYRIYYNKNTKKLYGINQKVISKYETKDGKASKLLDFAELSSVEIVENILVTDTEEIYILASNDNEAKVIKYEKADEQTSIAQSRKKRLNFEIFIDGDNIISNAAREFEKLHPDVKINVIDTKDTFFNEDYYKRINTELMAGKGSDIISSWSMPISDYVDKGVLVNFDEMIKNDKEFNLCDYDTKMLENSRYKGGLYAIPMTYSIECFMANEKLLKDKDIKIDDSWNWKDLYDISERLNSEGVSAKYYVLPTMVNPHMPLESMVFQDLDFYVDKKNKAARFNSKEFMDVLKLYERIQKGNVINPYLTDDSFLSADGKIGGSNTLLIPVYADSYQYVSVYEGLFDGKYRFVPLPKGEHTDTRFYPTKNVCINNNSEYKKEAWEFIKYLLSENIQKKLARKSFILHKSAQEEEMRIQLGYSREQSEEVAKQYEKHVQEINHIKDDVINKGKPANELYEVIFDEIYAFTKGERTAEETAKNLQNKVQLYLNE